MSFFSKILVKFGTKIHFLSQISPCTPLHFAKIHQHGPTTFGVGRTKVGGGCKNPFFYRKNGFFAGPLQKFISTDPQHLGSAEKNSQKSIFLQKNQNFRYFLQKFISTDPQHLGSDEKNSQKSIFLQKNQNLRYFLQKFIRREKRPKKGNCYHYTYKGCYLFIFTK